jgi:quercetin dioxygenase-like cupin family protein
MGIIEHHAYEPIVGDPDDHRPNSVWTIAIDPASRGADGGVRGLTLIFERIAPGDAIPLHTHSVEEVVIVDAGRGEATLGGDRRTLDPEACLFIPPGTPHGMRNAGEGVLRLHAAFAASAIDVTYLERNPAPGTENAPPQPPVVYDPRA